MLRNAAAWIALWCGCLLPGVSHARETADPGVHREAATPIERVIRVAVAANFATAFELIVQDFEAVSGARVASSPGATGALYAQIRSGAPFDVFLAADTLHPGLLVNSGRAVADTRFTYAVGRLVLWSADPERIGGDGLAALRASDVRKLAVANPKIAPYGRAAAQALQRLGLLEMLEPKLVFGQNVGQTLHFVESGAAQLGFVALSQTRDPRVAQRGSQWLVPVELYDPLGQDAVLLEHGRSNEAARALLDFLHGQEALAVLERFGYGLP